MADGVLDRFQESAFVKRLFDEIERPALDCRNCHLDITMAGDKDDRENFVGNASHQVQARRAWHTHVGNDAVKFQKPLLRLQECVSSGEARSKDSILFKIK